MKLFLVSKTSHISVQDLFLQSSTTYFNPGCALNSSCSEMFEKIPRKRFVVKSFSSKVAGLNPATLLKKDFTKDVFWEFFVFRTAFVKNTSEQLELKSARVNQVLHKKLVSL